MKRGDRDGKFAEGRARWAAALGAALMLLGCGGAEEPAAAAPEAGAESAELRIGGGGPRLGYSCTNGTCTCDKSIENDCEDMSAVCTDATVDALIKCIDGWLTTHCVCTKAFTAPGTSPTHQLPIGPVLGAR